MAAIPGGQSILNRIGNTSLNWSHITCIESVNPEKIIIHFTSGYSKTFIGKVECNAIIDLTNAFPDILNNEVRHKMKEIASINDPLKHRTMANMAQDAQKRVREGNLQDPRKMRK